MSAVVLPLRRPLLMLFNREPGVVAAGAFFLQGQESSQALVTGLAAGFAVAVVVHALAELYFVTRERWGLTYDPD